MVDRLKDLGNIPAMDDEEPAEENVNEFMQDFFQKVASVKQQMSKIRRNIKQIEEHHAEALVAISAELGKQHTEELEALMEETNDMTQDVSRDLKAMDKANKEFIKENTGSSESRIRTSMHSTLTRKFMDLMTEYQDIQAKYKEKYRERVKRQYKIVKPEASEEEIEEAAEGNPQNIFADQILSPGHAAAKNALADIQEKHQDILRLEKSIQELYQLFVDMSVLVETQGDLLNQIEHNVDQSVAYVDKGVSELQKASDYQKAARKKMFCICCCIVIIGGIAAGVVFGALKVGQ